MVVQVSRHHGGIILDCHGSANRDEIGELRGSLSRHCNELGRIQYLMIDLTNAALPELSTAELHKFASMAVAKASEGLRTLVAVIVARRDLEFGLSRMWQILIEQTGWRTMIFRSRPEAECWITGNLHALSEDPKVDS